jgi:hypothetical protein
MNDIGCVRKVLSDRSVQNGVWNGPNVRKVVWDRSYRSAHFRTSAASDDGVSGSHKFFSRSVWHRRLRLFTRVEIKIKRSVFGGDQMYQLNQHISERYGCDQTEFHPCSDHLPNAFFCGPIDRIEPIVVSEHTHIRSIHSS